MAPNPNPNSNTEPKIDDQDRPLQSASGAKRCLRPVPDHMNQYQSWLRLLFYPLWHANSAMTLNQCPGVAILAARAWARLSRAIRGIGYTLRVSTVWYHYKHTVGIATHTHMMLAHTHSYTHKHTLWHMAHTHTHTHTHTHNLPLVSPAISRQKFVILSIVRSCDSGLGR